MTDQPVPNQPAWLSWVRVEQELVAQDDPRWQQLREPFDASHIEKLPKPLKTKDENKGICNSRTYSADGYLCGKWHARSVHLDYVGHAGITMRLNAVDPFWQWVPMSIDPRGLPYPSDGGLWILMTVLGLTRIAFGDAAGKNGPNAVKEMIGDALRNGGLRFGIGTYLWSKSDYAESLKAIGEDAPDPDPEYAEQEQQRALLQRARTRAWGMLKRMRPDLDQPAGRAFAEEALQARGTVADDATAEDWLALAGEWEQVGPPAPPPPPEPGQQAELTPEQIEVRESAGPPKASPGQVKMLAVLLSNLGVQDDVERYWTVETLTGVSLGEVGAKSTKRLTSREAKKLIDILQKLADGAALQDLLNKVAPDPTPEEQS